MITTYVNHLDKTYRVSTINRECSSAESYGLKYAETLVWEWDTKEYKVKGDILLMGSSPEGSIFRHQKIVEMIHTSGIKEEGDD
jgi:hypothetical protein